MGGGRAAALDALLAALGSYQDTGLELESVGSVGEQLIALDAVMNRLRHEQALLAARFDSAGGAVADGLPSTATWLRANTTAAPGEAASVLRTGRQLRDRLPNTAAGLRTGELGWAAAQTIAHGLRHVTDDAVVAEAEAVLAGQARQLSPTQLGYAVRHTLQLIDPATAQRDAAHRYEQRALTLAPMLDGEPPRVQWRAGSPGSGCWAGLI